jgi:hypothetical protein
VIDEGVREALAIEVDTSLPAERVIRVLGSSSKIGDTGPKMNNGTHVPT